MGSPEGCEGPGDDCMAGIVELWSATIRQDGDRLTVDTKRLKEWTPTRAIVSDRDDQPGACWVMADGLWRH